LDFFKTEMPFTGWRWKARGAGKYLSPRSAVTWEGVYPSEWKDAQEREYSAKRYITQENGFVESGGAKNLLKQGSRVMPKSAG
jgi:hypothetical protein